MKKSMFFIDKKNKSHDFAECFERKSDKFCKSRKNAHKNERKYFSFLAFYIKLIQKYVNNGEKSFA